MEPITTTALISTVVGYLAKKFSDSKSFKDFTVEFSEAAVNWIKPIFIKEDGAPKEVLSQLQEKPDSNARQKAAESTLEVALEDNEAGKAFLMEMYEKIKGKEVKGEQIQIIGSSNVVTGNIHAGGNVIVGDNNTTNK